MELEVDDTFQCNLLVIRVENRIFRVPRELFEEYSSVFKDMFSLPSLANESQRDGERDSRPLYLESVLKKDFHAFLTVLSSLHYESIAKNTDKTARKVNFVIAKLPLYDGLDQEKWIAALRLSHMWGFDEVRAKAIDILDKDSKLGSLERLKLAHELFIKDWVRPAYRSFLTRDETVTQEEVPWLGPDFIASVTKAREERIRLLFMRLLTGEIPTQRNCVLCGRSNSMRVLFSEPYTTPPTITCSCMSIYLSTDRDITLERVLRDGKNLQKQTVEEDLDKLIDKYLAAF